MAVARRRHRYESVLELTPLLDVIFLLLIFFMVSTSFVVNREILIQLPESSSANIESTDHQLTMGIDADGNFSLDGVTFGESKVAALAEVLKGKLGSGLGEKPAIRLDVDKATDYRFVIKAMDACRQAGISDVRLNTRSKD
ncbi:MAG: hypothetical protein CMQ22_02165 [Gammaproteobacteria bacterium]|nr:hypothetical protein [Gammaproteobacteria bacterium]